jgi:hypothetical protein
MDTEVVSIEKFDGYEVRTELAWAGDQEDEKVLINSAYTPSGDYIGDPQLAARLIEYGIAPELRTQHSQTCTIGYSAAKGKWFGWSHRGLCGFGIGDKLFDYAYGDEKKPFSQRGNITIETLEQAKRAACNFAEYSN